MNLCLCLLHCVHSFIYIACVLWFIFEDISSLKTVTKNLNVFNLENWSYSTLVALNTGLHLVKSHRWIISVFETFAPLRKRTISRTVNNCHHNTVMWSLFIALKKLIFLLFVTLVILMLIIIIIFIIIQIFGKIFIWENLIKVSETAVFDLIEQGVTVSPGILLW